MRKTMTSLTLFVASLTIAGIASGQFPGGFQGGGGGMDALTLLRNPSVKKELEITEDQTKAIPGAIDKAIAGVLSDKQMSRLRQIELQQKGTGAYLDATIQEKLKMTDTQKDSIKTIVDDSRKELRELGFGKGGREKIDTIRKAAQEKIDEVLSLDQKAAWKKMVGETFKIEFGGGTFKKKTTDN